MTVNSLEHFGAEQIIWTMTSQIEMTFYVNIHHPRGMIAHDSVDPSDL